MILNKLTLVNFGVYRGEHSFDLRPQAQAPIVIIGGKNGAGKTTLLEAMRLCLYGALMPGESSRLARPGDYEQYLRERIHRSPDSVIPLDWAKVELEFEYAVAGERQTFTVARSWKNNNKRLEETLQVLQADQPLEAVDVGQWQDFTRELIPPGLAQLLFFDSERIQSLTSTLQDGYRAPLSQAIKALFGLNLVDQLQADLGIYRRRQQKGGDVDNIDQQIQSLEDDLSRLNAEEEVLAARQLTLAAQIQEIQNTIAQQEQDISRVGGGFARQREMHKASQVRLKAEIEAAEQAIRDLCSGLLPFAITPAYTTAVKEQLAREAGYQDWLASKAFIEQRLGDVRSRVESPEFWQGTGAEFLIDLQAMMSRRVVETLQSMVEPPDAVRNVVLRHHASEPERRQLLQWIEESQTTVPEQIQQLTARLAQLNEERQETEQVLQRVPHDDVLRPLVEKLNQYHQELGVLVQQQRQNDEALQRMGQQREELKRKVQQARQDKTARQKLSDKIRCVVDVQLALDDFEAQLLRLRVSQLEEAFASCFNQLCRKNRLVQRVDINPDDFSVGMVGAGGATIPHTELSAGEKQIYALALLWALRQVSGKPLPVVIDAPLGRLDGDHRRNLVERYFPQASHQVILFSTDTEVGADFYAAMQERVAHAYHLDYDQAQGMTVVNRGYFWQSNGEYPR